MTDSKSPQPSTPAKPSAMALWRLDPAESFSDWTLEITSGRLSTDYAVHRLVLGAGSRRCDYFTKVFGGEFEESKKKISKIVLHELLADRFPDFLDYCYAGQAGYTNDDMAPALALTYQTAMPMFQLAEYFGNQRLVDYTKAFLYKDLSSAPGQDLTERELADRFLVYYKHLQMWPHQELEIMLASAMGRHLTVIPCCHPVLKDISPAFWLTVMDHCEDTSDPNHLIEATMLVLLDPKNIPSTDFYKIASRLPPVSASQASTLLKLESELKDRSDKSMKAFHDRSLDAIAANFDYVDFDKELDYLKSFISIEMMTNLSKKIVRKKLQPKSN